MNIKNTKKPSPRVDVGYLQKFGIQSYGADNLYPQNLTAVTNCSGTAELCLARYAKFIEGNGFNSTELSEVVVNKRKETADDILKSVSADLARFGGFTLHCNYNVFGEITEVAHIPFEQCRLAEEDDLGNVSHIVVHPDWRGKKSRSGKTLQVNENTITRIHTFNPSAALSQIASVGGIEHYNGQVLWVSADGAYRYPTPIYDAVITEISTDEGLGNLKYRNVRNNFMTACMLVAKKGVPRIDDEGNEIERQMISADDLTQFQGDERSNKIMYIEIENDEDKPEVVPFPIQNLDKEFTATDESVIERIYAQFHQELFYSIRLGKLGFSGQVMRDAYEYYASEVTNEQRMIQRAFAAIGKYMPKIANYDYTVQPLVYKQAYGNK